MIVMHGVLGNKTNWRGIVSRAKIARVRQSYLVDMRNHGDSDWHDEVTYESMAEDVVRFADQQGLNRFTVMGHSLGGRTAMYVAGKYPDRLDGLICVDIPPVSLSNDPSFGLDAKQIFKFLVAHQGKSREEIKHLAI